MPEHNDKVSRAATLRILKVVGLAWRLKYILPLSIVSGYLAVVFGVLSVAGAPLATIIVVGIIPSLAYLSLTDGFGQSNWSKRWILGKHIDVQRVRPFSRAILFAALMSAMLSVVDALLTFPWYVWPREQGVFSRTVDDILNLLLGFDLGHIPASAKLLLILSFALLVLYTINTSYCAGKTIKEFLARPTYRNAPGATLLALAELLYSRETVERTFEPLTAEWQHEYFELLKENRRWKSLIRSMAWRYGFLKAMGLCKVLSLVKWIALIYGFLKVSDFSKALWGLIKQLWSALNK
jgi:hypothetical protein